LTCVSSKVEALSSTMDEIISSFTIKGENSAGIEADLVAAQSQLKSIIAALENVITSKELALISSSLADLQADINETLENNAIVSHYIIIKAFRH